MKLPKTTPDKPYVEFRIDKNGKIKLSASSSWWGGKNAGFISSDGTHGNTCEPKHFNAHFEFYMKKKEKNILKQISELEKLLKEIKTKNRELCYY